MDKDSIAFRVEETPEVPALGLLLGGSAMVPFVLLAAALWLAPGPWRPACLRLLIYWGASVLGFLAGVRRGLSFRSPGGDHAGPIVTMLWLFVLAFAALAVPGRMAALALLLAGYASLAVMDPAAARRQEAPLFFARLRPLQMLIPIACLAAAALWRDG